MAKRVPEVFLKIWREHYGLSQEALGERLGMTKSQVSELETGKRRWYLDLLVRVAFALDPRLDWLDLLRPPSEAPPFSALAARISEANRSLAARVLEGLAEPRRDDDFAAEPRPRATSRQSPAKTKRRAPARKR